MQESKEIIDMIIQSTAFKATVGTLFSTLTVWFLVKVKNIPTKKELKEVECTANKYTDERIKVHEDKQVLELSGITSKLNDTHRMVSELYNFHLKK